MSTIYRHNTNNPCGFLNIPIGTTEIHFGDEFNQPMTGYVSQSVTCIHFGNSFNQEISGLLPDSILELKFGNDFNQPITVLPKNLKVLEFGTNP